MARGQVSSTSKRKKNDTGVIDDSLGPMTQESLLKFYRDMLLIRRFEERTGQQYGLGKIAGFCHLYIGQEAVAVGANEAIRPGCNGLPRREPNGPTHTARPRTNCCAANKCSTWARP